MAKHKRKQGDKKQRAPRMTREERVALFWKQVAAPGGIHLRF